MTHIRSLVYFTPWAYISTTDGITVVLQVRNVRREVRK